MRRIYLQLFAEGQEPATPKRRREARQKGQIARSQEIGTIAVLASGFIALQLIAPNAWEKLRMASTTFFAGRQEVEWTVHGINSLSWQWASLAAALLFPFFAVVVIVGLSAQLGQIGFYFGGHGLVPRFSRLNPIEGFKRIFSKRAAVEWLKNLFKLLFIGWLGYSFLQKGLKASQQSAGTDILTQLSVLLHMVQQLVWYVIGLFLVITVADYLYQRWELEQSLRMTKEEIRQEMKQTEGDPWLRGRRREIQRDLVRQMMLHAVPQADVVITNPTHIAVALRYTEDMDAPVVVAKGKGWLAERIKEIARDHQIVIMEDRRLARALDKLVDVGQPIPEQLYKAVAEVLAFVWQIKGREVR